MPSARGMAAMFEWETRAQAVCDTAEVTVLGAFGRKSKRPRGDGKGALTRKVVGPTSVKACRVRILEQGPAPEEGAIDEDAAG